MFVYLTLCKSKTTTTHDSGRFGRRMLTPLCPHDTSCTLNAELCPLSIKTIALFFLLAPEEMLDKDGAQHLGSGHRCGD